VARSPLGGRAARRGQLPIEPAFACSGQIVAVAPEREEIEGERARPRAVRFTNVPAEARQRLDRYLEERKRT
jgi:hypothetical protein